ncbi:hypothetical protein SAMN05660443_2527 [Marinospirillum celere]|uniref:Cytochrome oxidase Cu insertion factor, SCO1/SenC/PrrC family n=1 Tax=Marinospirillum celere TaxID=1122252 RepID=A0A1I1J2J4_9GAMM|nr:hypothetical protein [Marinospirillum celere]SFC40153.1 hypothetical protein SAMN05660443_2527 [Marinospirillum celere]
MSNRIKLLLLMILMAAPVMASWSMHLFKVGIPEQQTAKGDLLPELPPLAEWPLDWQADGRWWLVMAADQECAAVCDQQADKLWRIHRALGREAERVFRLRAGGDDALPGEVAEAWTGLPPEGVEPGKAWIVDPQGQVVLAYQADVEPGDIHRDLMRLLRINQDQGR